LELASLSFLFSCFVLFQAVLFLGYTPFKADIASVLTFLGAVSIVLFVMLKKIRSGTLPPKTDSAPEGFDALSVFAVSVFTALIFFRSFFQPMISPDSVFRWNHMAELIYQKGSIAFYPPSSVDDFMIYPYPDGFPPFVSSLYFWLYACLGGIIPSATAFLTAIQFLLICFYVHKGSVLFHGGKNSARFSLFALLSSSLFFFAVFLGQETGWTALSAAMFFYYALKMKNNESITASTIMLSLSASIGALSREYGPVFVAMIPLALPFFNIPRKNIAIAFSIAAAMSSPFYLMNFFVNGNPFYPLSFPGGFLPYNEIYHGLLSEYSRHFGVFTNPSLLIVSLKIFIFSAPLQMLAFLYAFGNFGKNKIFCLYVIAIFAVWLYSTTYACGGIHYSVRLLSPALVVLSIVAGHFAKFAEKWNLPGALWKFCGFSILSAAFLFQMLLPASPFEIPPGSWLNSAFGKRVGIEAMIFKYAGHLPEKSVALSDSALYTAELYRGGNGTVRLVPLWSPELIFLYNDRMSFADKINVLKKSGFTHIMKTNQSANNDFFGRFSFFQKYPLVCEEVIRGDDSTIYKL
jgi:hypothetical protein